MEICGGKKNIGVALKMLHPAVAERQRANVGELVGERSCCVLEEAGG